MNAIALLMGLLVLSYVGSLLVGTGKTRGLASGIEFVGLGFAVGPQALALTPRSMIDEFEPIVEVALGWLAFLVGLHFGRVDNASGGSRRVQRRNVVVGNACALVTGILVGAVVWRVLAFLPVRGVDAMGRVVLAAGAGAVAAETARNAVEWVGARWGSKGPLSRLLVDLGAADDAVPLVAAGAIFAIAPSSGLAFALPLYGWFVASLALGALLGIVTAMLLRGAEGDAVWGALIGTLLLVVGTAARFGLSTIFVTFVMGLALAAASPSRQALRKLVGPTERAVLYPMLVLAGARLDPRPMIEDPRLLDVVVVVLLVRIAAKLLSGLFIRNVSEPAKPAGPLLGIVLLSSGPVSTSCGLVLALRFPGPVGDTLLVCAVASSVLGELVSTFALKALLTEAGEIVPALVAPTPAGPSTIPPPAAPSSRSASTIPPPMPLESRYAVGDNDDDPGG